MVLPLSHLSPGDSGQIVWIASGPEMKNQLEARGFIPGESVVCILAPRRGDLFSCRLCGTVFALRRRTAREIFIELKP